MRTGWVWSDALERPLEVEVRFGGLVFWVHGKDNRVWARLPGKQQMFEFRVDDKGFVKKEFPAGFTYVCFTIAEWLDKEADMAWSLEDAAGYLLLRGITRVLIYPQEVFEGVGWVRVEYKGCAYLLRPSGIVFWRREKEKTHTVKVGELTKDSINCALSGHSKCFESVSVAQLLNNEIEGCEDVDELCVMFGEELCPDAEVVKTLYKDACLIKEIKSCFSQVYPDKQRFQALVERALENV